MRKGLILVTSFLTFVFLLPVTSQAQNITPPGEQKRIEAKERVEQKIVDKDNVRAEVEKRVEERKASQELKVQKIRQERIRRHWNILTKRLNAMIVRLEILTSRIESRLSKISQEDPDLDVSKITTDIEIAKELINDSKVKLDEATSDLENLLESEDPKTAFEVLRTTIKEIRDLLIDAHRILVHTIGDIKGLRVGEGNPTTTSTPAIEVTPTVVVSTPTVVISPTPVEEGL